MRLAVTGGSGFLARHVLPRLVQEGHRPVVLLRGDAPPPPWVGDLPVTRFDLATSPANAFELLGHPDLLIHLAWSGLPNYRSLHHLADEFPVQLRFLRSLIAAGLGRLVVTGTCFEYGMQSGPLRETTPTQPDNPYGLAKDVLRRGLEFIQRSNPFELAWARLFYTYGEGQASTSLLPQLEDAVAKGAPAFAMSGGEQLRDFLPVETLAADLVKLALISGDHGVVNLCSGSPTSVRSLVERHLQRLDAKLDLDLGRHPYPDYEPMAFWGSREKLDRILTSS